MFPKRRLFCCVFAAAWLFASGPSFPQRTVDAQDDIISHFKYGSIGTEASVGIPYRLWRVLPEVFADKLPRRPGRGYERLGFIYEADPPQGRPIGTTYKDGFVPLVGLNCATCHTGTVRDSASGARRIIPGMPAHQLDLQGYANFLTAAAEDDRFNASTLIEAMRTQDASMGWLQALIYRYLVINRTREGILERAKQNEWFKDRPLQGPGRVDTFNPYKRMFNFDLKADRSVGTADLPPLFSQRVRRGLYLHWDGNNNELEERNKSAAIGAGATPESLDLASLDRVAAWTLDLAPPRFPVHHVDAVKASRGRPIYESKCSRCHAIGGSEVGQVTPLTGIGTDAERLHSFTTALAERMNTIGTGRPWKFSHFRKTEGYANMPLDGVWLRAPYLHNGSVPTLRALLFPEERPAVFYRAYDVYDWGRVGFVSEGPEAERDGVKFETTLRGNGNSGHLYGSELPASDREDLLEYLKTL